VSAEPPSTRLAYRHCESLTRAAAGNFYYGIRLLPAVKRRAMCAVYAFARRIDDIGDGQLEPQEKLRRLDELERALQTLSRVDPDPVMVALADAHTRFALPLDALGDLIAGVRMDVTGTSYAEFADLELYCRRVAGSIGRLCLAIFGHREVASAHAEEGSARRSAAELADDLGVAMQIANIVRDLREDAGNGRVYIPAKDLGRYHLRARSLRRRSWRWHGRAARLSPRWWRVSVGETSGSSTR
jgi:phytoene synthase